MPPLLREIWPEDSWRRFVRLAGVLTFVGAIWIFAEMADDAPEGDYLELENRILLAFRQDGNPQLGIGPDWMPEVARDVTGLGSAVVLTLVTASIVGFLALRGRLRTAALILSSSLGGYLLSNLLKGIFARGRPTAVPHLMEEVSMSFPSGHSMVASAFYLTLGALLAQTVARRREKSYCVLIALLLSFLIGISRVYLGVHYPTDVLAGWAAGTAWAILCWSIACWLQLRGSIRNPDSADGEVAFRRNATRHNDQKR